MEVVHYRTADNIDIFNEWLAELKDMKAKVNIARKINDIRLDRFGNTKPLKGVSELKIDIGAGYRVYYFKYQQTIVILCGGDKTSQKRDIRKAQSLKADFLSQV